ncbi:immunoglobulin lambda-1 light chain-like [Hyperolius riggenbachi]|uniref:immunoglobulin lambda-1 light chain-like n=1 Tax=Hyperolius riggenbachi TaxID=752182 RepID=UPI0035A33D67
MAWTDLFVALALFYTSCGAQHVQLTQEPLISASINQRVILSCHLNTGTVAENNYPYWYQQKPGQHPRVVIHNTSGRPTGIPNRFSGSRSGNYAYMSISEAQRDDDATYYCLMWYNSAKQAVFGGGTQLIVKTGEVLKPVVFIYGPSEEELKTNKATCVCTASDFLPRVATMQWQVDGRAWKDGVYTSPISKQDDNKYKGSSFLTMTSSDYNSHKEISCKVTHEGQEIIKTLKISECS